MALFEVVLLASVAASFLYKILSYKAPGTNLKKAVKSVPKSDIESAPGNKVTKIIGEVVPLSEPLIAPFSGKQCVCYESVIEELRDEDGNKIWVTIAQDTHRQNFSLRQNTREALVKVRYAEIHLADLQTQSSSMTNAPRGVQELLERRGELSTGRRRKIRYREGVLEISKKAMVCGFAKREADLQAESSGYRDQGTRLVFEHQEEQNLYISNDRSLLS